MDSRIKTVLEYAVMAPSGDNCQPWKFTVDGLNVDLFNNPDQDRSLYNLKQRASLIAHGALLENIRLAAPSVGLQSQAALLPDPANQEQIASIRFTECKTEQTAHFKAIPQRQTNREKYQPVKISDSQVRQWQSLPDGPGQKITVAHQPSQINHLAKRLSLNDRLVFEIPALHRFLFEQLRWTDEEAQRTGDGLDIKTLGLNAMDRVSFRLLKHWGLVAACNRAGFTSIVQMKARQLIKSSAAAALKRRSDRPADCRTGLPDAGCARGFAGGCGHGNTTGMLAEYPQGAVNLCRRQRFERDPRYVPHRARTSRDPSIA
jgi:hypothetical protein